jgi:uncharacterized protein YbjT (DUF2867 family)
MKILLTGVTGYIGKRLLPVLLEENHEVVACVRNKQRFESPDIAHPNLKIIEVDFLNKNKVQLFPRDIEVAYYLIHSMSFSSKFELLEAQTAEEFSKLLNQTKCSQTIYLSGIDNATTLSPHLRSRKNVRNILRKASSKLTTIKAGIIVGSGSSSFEIIRDLVEKLPGMVTPRWVETETQPIAVRDVIQILNRIKKDPFCYRKDFDIGGPEVLTFRKLLLIYARTRELKRFIIPIPVLTPKLSSYWLYFVTSTNYKLATSLVDSMKTPTICKNNDLLEYLKIKPIKYEVALKFAFDKIAQNLVLSTWKDAFINGRVKNHHLEQYMEVPKFGCFKEVKAKVFTSNLLNNVKANIWSIGGHKGWYYANWLWKFRGLIDRFFGGVGLARGRNNLEKIKVGEALDFWRVIIADKKNNHLLLFAEMKVPGEAWLEFSIQKTQNENYELTQTATFRPKGILGRMYWWSTKPFHYFIFSGMVNKLINS